MDRNVSRREFLRIAGVAGAAVGLAGGLGGLVAACGEEEVTTTTVSTEANAGPVTTAPGAPPAGRPPAGGAVVTLPGPMLQSPVSLEDAIKRRRSLRDYTAEPLTLEEVAQLMWAAQGVTDGRIARAAPSAGGTYPLEVLVAASQVTGLEPGVYRYRPREHDLLAMGRADVRTNLARASLDQEWVAQAPVNVVMSGIYERTTERYGERGVRYVYMEAGHAAENLLLQAVSLGLGAVVVGAFHDDQVSSVVGLAGDERPLYVIPVGRPAL